MARRAEDFELDPVVVPIPDDGEGSVDEWLASLLHDEPIELPIPAAQLLADVRANQE